MEDIKQPTTKELTDKAFGAARVPIPGMPADAAAAAPVPPVVPPAAAAIPDTVAGAVETPVPEPKNYDDITEEEFDALLAKRSKGKVKTIKELTDEAPPVKTAKELAEEEEAEKTQALAWAISAGKVKREDYDNSVKDKSKTAREIALTILTKEWMDEDKALAEGDCEELFKDMFFEQEPEASNKRKSAQKRMDKLAADHLAQYSGMDTIHEDYRGYKTTESNKSAIGKKVDSVFETVTTEMKLTGNIEGTDVEIAFALDAADLKEIKKASKKVILEQCLAKGIDPKNLKESEVKDLILYDIKAKTYDKAIAHTANESYKKGKLDWEAEHKGILQKTVSQQPYMGKPGQTSNETKRLTNIAFPYKNN